MRLWTWLLDLLFPPRCVFCHRLLSEKQTELCARCRVELPRTQRAVRRGGVPVCYSPYDYDDEVKQSLHRFKFQGRSFYAEAYGREIAMHLLRNEVRFDLLTWVPVSKKRRRERGYDQTQLLAQAVARELGVTAQPLLTKLRDNPPQSTRSGVAERRGNVLGVYRVSEPSVLRGKRVLLIDDVITTGATLGECVRVLSTAGASSVVCATLAATRKK